MARSFSNAKLLSAIVADAVSGVCSRRGFAAATAGQGAVPSSAKVSGVAALMNKGTSEESVTSTFKVTWGPDPTTGYYRPESGAVEIDVADLRAALLKKNNN